MPFARTVYALLCQPILLALHQVGAICSILQLTTAADCETECFAAGQHGLCAVLNANVLLCAAADCGSGQVCNSAKVCATPVPLKGSCTTSGQLKTLVDYAM